MILTASAAGLVTSPALGAYAASKHAVVGMGAVLRDELAPARVGVSILCPGVVPTRIFHSERNSPADLDGPTHADNEVVALYREVAAASPLTPAAVAAATLDAVRSSAAFVLPSPELDELVRARHAEVAAAMDRR